MSWTTKSFKSKLLEFICGIVNSGIGPSTSENSAIMMMSFPASALDYAKIKKKLRLYELYTKV